MDVGGQRSERRKWIHYFDEVEAVVFVASLSCYNEMMLEDRSSNCMVDALQLFEGTINNEHFLETQIILFLNKRDLFAKKVAAVPITVCPSFADFAEYDHHSTIHRNPNDCEQTMGYIQMKFESLNSSQSKRRKQIYTHITCAMDRSNIENVFKDVTHIVISQSVYNEGFS